MGMVLLPFQHSMIEVRPIMKASQGFIIGYYSSVPLVDWVFDLEKQRLKPKCIQYKYLAPQSKKGMAPSLILRQRRDGPI